MTLKVAYVLPARWGETTSWSKTSRHMARSLEDPETEVEVIGPLQEPFRPRGSMKRRIHRLSGRTYQHFRDARVAHDYARQIARSLANRRVSLVISPSAIPVAFLPGDVPVAFWTDATFPSLVGYHPGYIRLSSETLEDGYATERAALERSSAAIFASEWAAQSAIQNYEPELSRLHVIPYGANLDGLTSLDEARTAIGARPRNVCRLLFVAVDWHLKGGEEALLIAQRLNDRGLTSVLTIVGCRPEPPRPLPPHVQLAGFISQASDDGRRRLQDLFATSHFLLLPAAVEAFGVALAEASAHAVPSLATATGGITTVVRRGQNGELFQLGDVDAYCDCIERLFSNYDDEYVELAESSFSEGRTRLNWGVSGSAVRRILHSVQSLCLSRDR